MRGLYNYFKCTDAFYRLQQIFTLLRSACYKTLVSKYKIGSVTKLFKKFNKDLSGLTKTKLFKAKTTKVPLIKVIKNNEVITTSEYNNTINTIWLKDTKDVLTHCSLCDSTENLESHHVKSIKNLRDKYNLNKNKYKFYN